MWGNGTSGQLGNNEKQNSDKPTFVEFFHGIEVESAECSSAQSAVITKEGKLYTWGWHGTEPTFTPELVSSFDKFKVTRVSLGGYHIMALVEDNEQRSFVYTWGMNKKGQLGNGTTTSSKIPILVESLTDHVIADVAASESISGIITSNLQY